MRVRGGDDYLAYVRRLLFDQAAVPQTFSNYEFRLHASFTEFEDLFERTLEEHPLTRMVAGYSWKWVSNGKANSHLFDISIDGVEKRWNRTFRDWVGKGMRNRDIALEVGCIHSTQGYDLSHAFVIIGPDLTFDPSRGRIRIDGDRYFDRSGKRGATDADLDTYIKNIYYVLLTRGIEATHVYVCDRELRRHLARFIET
jgi:DUF2075 family protein